MPAHDFSLVGDHLDESWMVCWTAVHLTRSALSLSRAGTTAPALGVVFRGAAPVYVPRICRSDSNGSQAITRLA